VPDVNTDYQQSLENTWTGNANAAKLAVDDKSGVRMLYAEFADNVGVPTLSLTSRVRTRNRAVDWSRTDAPAEDPAVLRANLQPTELIPIDGIVRKTALEATQGASSDLDKVRGIYDWVVTQAHREPTVRGCGIGDIKAMLETRNFGGKCADLNALYVGLARSAGLPARDVYGLRVVKSDFGYRSLGAGTPNVTRAQHCRAEVFLTGYGWVPIDPADVRKVVLEEKPQPTTLADPVVPSVRKALFGGWEMNWLAYNDAHYVKLPGSSAKPIGFLMYPQAETGKERLDSLDPDNFKYTITAREIKA